MQWADWEPMDREIRATFGYGADADREAARRLHALAPRPSRWRDLRAALRNRRDIVVLGCGPDLGHVQASHLAGRTVVACDGASRRLMEIGAPPSVVVTDLDGDPEGLRWAAAAGAYLVVHAHGDNVSQLEALVPALGPLVLGTYATAPDEHLAPLRSLGGFTDGDRAVVLLEDVEARHATLVAFQFDAEPSRYSHRWDPETKPRKLGFARRVVEDVARRGRLSLAHWRPPGADG